MSRWGKIGWVVCGISFVILLGTRFVLTGWSPALFLPLGLFLGSLIFSILVDIRHYIEFLAMKPTKYGLNMGLVILLFVTLVTAINVMAIRHNISWDLTEEKVNSLAESTLKFLRNLDQDIKVTVFYSGVEARQAKVGVKEIFQNYQEQTPRLHVEYVDSYVYRRRADEYLRGAELSGLTAFVELGDKKVEVSAPVSEEGITSALIKLTRGETKKVYFLTGHGERSITDGQGEGVKSLAQALERVSLEVGELNLFDRKQIPVDADVLAIVGPKSPYISSEIDLIEKFLRRGGGLIAALDPNQDHQLSEWLKTLGVGFKGNLVVSPFVVLTGRGQTATAGRVYDKNHKITRDFDSNTLTIFDWTSELEVSKTAKSDIEITPLVQTDGNAVGVIFNSQGKDPTTENPGQRTLSVTLQGKYPKDTQSPKGSKDFRMVVFGDSDFVSVKDIIHYGNMSLAVNTVSYLAGEEDVLGITPNTWKETTTRMTPYQIRSVVLGGFLVPVVMLIGAGVLFYRRRNL